MQASNRLTHAVLSLIDYKFYWLIPLALGVGASIIYVVVLHAPTYTARQSLIVRDDLMGTSFKPSRFESLDSMKSAQETILEIARKPEVIRKVLEQLGSKSFFASSNVSDDVIEQIQGNIELGAPNGAEFGRTEAVILRVTAAGRDEALEFTNLLLDQIDAKLSEVRHQRLQGMQKELTLASDESLSLMTNASILLQEKERGFGVELAAMRGLNDPQGGNTFDLKLNQIRVEKRQAVNAWASALQQKQLLETAQKNGTLEVVTSRQLLEMQPALAAMMRGLTNAQERLAVDEGRYKSLHPVLKASRESVRHQKEMVVNSLGTMIRGLDSQISMAQSQVARLDRAIFELEEKLVALNGERVNYDTIQTDFKNKAKLYGEVQSRLSQIQSYASSTENVGLLSRIDEPQVGTRPNGLGRKTIVMVGGFFGLMTGLGLVALLVPPVESAEYYAHSAMRGAASAARSSMDPVPENRSAQSTAPQTSTPAKPAPTPSTHTVSESRLLSAAGLEQQRQKDERLALQQQRSSANEAAGSAIPDAAAKHLAHLKKASTKEADKPADPAPIAVSEVTAKTPTRDKLSSADVVAAFKAKQLGGGGAAPAKEKLPSMRNPDNANRSSTLPQPSKLEKKPSEAIGSIRDTLKELDAAKAKRVQQPRAAAQLKEAAEPRKAAPSHTAAKPKEAAKSDVRVVERKRGPDVPDEIAAGRITAESLIQSSQRRGKGELSPPHEAADKSSASKSPIAVQRRPAEAPILGKAKAELSDPNQQGRAQHDSTRLPSITDYAKSLDDSANGLLKNRSVEELTDPTKSNDSIAPQRRSPPMRPVDIAQSLDGIDSVRGILGDIAPSEAQPALGDSAPLARRATEATVPTKMADNSLVGLMRQARESDPQAIDQSVMVDVVAAEKEINTPAKPLVADRTPQRASADRVPIPEQIRQLSDSISSFARPQQPSKSS